MKNGRWALVAAAALAVAGCGMDPLRTRSATDVTTASAAVVTRANVALDRAKPRREPAYETVIASDPSAADRKKATEFSLQQILEGLHLIASAVVAWGMV